MFSVPALFCVKKCSWTIRKTIINHHMIINYDHRSSWVYSFESVCAESYGNALRKQRYMQRAEKDTWRVHFFELLLSRWQMRMLTALSTSSCFGNNWVCVFQRLFCSLAYRIDVLPVCHLVVPDWFRNHRCELRGEVEAVSEERTQRGRYSLGGKRWCCDGADAAVLSSSSFLHPSTPYLQSLSVPPVLTE